MEKRSAQGREYYHFLKRKMILLAVAVSFTPLILISCIILYQFQVSYREKVLAHLEEVVLKHRQNIDSFLDEKLADILVMARTFSLDQLLDEAFLQGKLAILQEEHRGAFVDLGLVNEEGTQIAYAGAFKLGRVNYAESDWFKMAMEKQHFISDVFLGIRGLPHFIVAVKKEWQGRTWILRSTIDFVAFNTLVENLRIGKTGLAFIVNTRGEFQTKPPLSTTLDSGHYLDNLQQIYSQQRQSAADRSHSQTSAGLLQKAVAKDPVSVIKKDPTLGRDYISVITPLKGGDWLLIYRQDAADAFADLYRTHPAIRLGDLDGLVPERADHYVCCGPDAHPEGHLVRLVGYPGEHLLPVRLVFFQLPLERVRRLEDLVGHRYYVAGVHDGDDPRAVPGADPGCVAKHG